MTSTSQSRFVYVIHIATTPEKLWDALTQPEFTKRYWCETWQESNWTPGSDWRAMIPDGRVADSGKIILADRPRKLVLTWENQFMPELKAEGHSTLTYELEQMPSSVKLTLTHEMARPASKLIDAVSQGWPSLMSSLKTMLETGQPLSETAKWPEGI